MEATSHLSLRSGSRINTSIYPLLTELQSQGVILLMVTNQAGINKGIVTWAQVTKINRYIVRELRKHGIHVAAVYVCPHRIEEHCRCRKPQPGLILQASKEHDISWVKHNHRRP